MTPNPATTVRLSESELDEIRTLIEQRSAILFDASRERFFSTRLLDFIEEKHAEGEPLEQALLDAGIIRLRPVLITVGATVIALIPQAAHGGPLWEPLCYSQIGGLCVATFITLLLVPVLYSIMVLDLKWVKWLDTVTYSAQNHL